MRAPILTLVLVLGLAAPALFGQQALVCPTAPAGRTCEAFHFHVQLYRPDTRSFVEVYAGAPFATQAACDRARDHHVAMNTPVVQYFRGLKQQYEADRVGPCHCDMTTDKASPTYLADSQRLMQLRTQEEVRLRVRERLLDHKLTSESEIVRGLWADLPVTPLLAAPKLAPLPQDGVADVVATSSDDLRATRTIDSSKPAVVALDIPLLDIDASGTADAAAAPSTPSEAPASAGSSPAPVQAPAEEEEVVVSAPVITQSPAAEPETVVESSVAAEDAVSAQETAEQFVSYETERIQNVLRASSAIADETVKSKIFEACMQRIQLLSNLRLLIEGSGMRSRLAAAAREARDEEQRLQLIGRLFGETIKPHWAPGDAADVVFDIEPEIATAPERALRDTTGGVTTEQKKRALYLVLAQTQPTEDQRLWLSSVVEGFLR